MITLSLSKGHDKALSPACGRQAQGERGEKEFKDDVIYQEYNEKSNLFSFNLSLSQPKNSAL
jgi:hypothetical protein